MTMSGTTSGPELLLTLDRAAADPLHRQLCDGLRAASRGRRGGEDRFDNCERVGC
jgi:GntR family transcriptional regulator / MocR family aminotransferase